VNALWLFENFPACSDGSIEAQCASIRLDGLSRHSLSLIRDALLDADIRLEQLVKRRRGKLLALRQRFSQSLRG
jgi:hypothetical protein